MRTTRKGRWLLSQPRSGARVRQAGLFAPDPHSEICRKSCQGPTEGREVLILLDFHSRFSDDQLCI